MENLSIPFANPILQESSRQEDTVECKGEVIFFGLTHHPSPENSNVNAVKLEPDLFVFWIL